MKFDFSHPVVQCSKNSLKWRNFNDAALFEHDFPFQPDGLLHIESYTQKLDLCEDINISSPKYFDVGKKIANLSDSLIAEEFLLEDNISNLARSLEGSDIFYEFSDEPDWIDVLLEKYKGEGLSGIVYQYPDIMSFADLRTALNEIRESKERINALRIQIRNLWTLLHGFYQDLRSIFKRNHCFHFKNLDDHHGQTLINRNAIN